MYFIYFIDFTRIYLWRVDRNRTELSVREWVTGKGHTLVFLLVMV